MPKAIDILIVEDEPLYSDLLEDMIADLGYNHMATFNNATDALEFVQNNKPNLLLLDIDIKGNLDGIELADAIQEIRPTPAIFITSLVDDQTYARAKATNPYAYLEKTFRKRQLVRAIDLVIQQLKESTANTVEQDQPAMIMVKVNQNLVRIDPNDLLFVQTEDHHCILQTSQHKYASRIALRELMEQLPSDAFFQTHRSYVVNLAKVTSISSTNGTLQVGGFEVPIGRSHKDKLMQLIKQI